MPYAAVMFDLGGFIDDCRHAMAEPDRIAAVRDVLDRVAAQPAAVAAALGTPTRGGIGRLHHASDLTVLNVVWTPGMTMAPHDHKMTAGLVVYGGREDNAFFRLGDERIHAAGGRTLEEGDVLLLGDEIVHSVTSHPDRYTGAIHVYLGDFFNRDRAVWCADDGRPDLDPPEVDDVFARAEQAWRAVAR
jgi:predicted metal-dependent enzyme (double-stranded beta helix superfamily)